MVKFFFWKTLFCTEDVLECKDGKDKKKWIIWFEFIEEIDEEKKPNHHMINRYRRIRWRGIGVPMVLVAE